MNENHASIHPHSIMLSLNLPHYYSAKNYTNFSVKVPRFFF